MKKTLPFLDRLGRFILPLCMMVMLLTLVACQGLDFRGSSSGSIPATTAPVLSALEQANIAFLEGKFKQAELFGRRAIGEEAQNPKNLALAYRIYATAAAENAHPNAALEALENWQSLEKGVDNSRDWQDVWALAMRQLSPAEIRFRTEKVWSDQNRGLGSRNVALVFWSIEQWRAGEIGTSLDMLSVQHQLSEPVALKRLLEERLLIELQRQPQAMATLLQSAVDETNQAHFPYAIVAIDGLRRELLVPEKAQTATEALAALAKVLTLADPSLVNGAHSRKIEPLIATKFVGTPVVLLLPLGGDIGLVSEKIVAGAQVAQRELATTGQTLSLVVIDTDKPDWLDDVKRLPKDVLVVGGPLRANEYADLQGQGLLQTRKFLTFLPRLQAGEEGSTAWRFFPSSEDQAKVLLGLTSSLGIKGVAILHPEDAYGEYMSNMFGQKAKANGVEKIVIEKYSPANEKSWLRSTGNLLAKNTNPEIANKATFRAIFLPDRWAAAKNIVSHIFYFGETRQLIMGSTLWGQEMPQGTPIDPAYAELLVFPGAWDPASTSPAKGMLETGLTSLGKGQGDFWYALGYDFARFVSTMSVSANSSASAFNQSLQNTHITWSMASMEWTEGGMATQNLFLLSPTLQDGTNASVRFAAIDELAFKEKFNQLWK